MRCEVLVAERLVVERNINTIYIYIHTKTIGTSYTWDRFPKLKVRTPRLA